VNDEDDLFADPYSIVVTCRKHFSKLLNYMRLMIVRQIEVDSLTTINWAKCLWDWVGYWKPKSQITRYWSIPSRID